MSCTFPNLRRSFSIAVLTDFGPSESTGKCYRYPKVSARNFKSHITASFDEPDIESHSSFVYQHGEIIIIKNEKKKHLTHLRRSSERLWCVAILQFHITAILDARSCRKTQRNKNSSTSSFVFATTCRSQSGCHVSQSQVQRFISQPALMSGTFCGLPLPSENPLNHRAEVLCNSC